jgi:hypothetical protein
MISLARLACDVPDGVDDAPMFAVVRELIDAFDRMSIEQPNNRRRLGLLILALTVARTPDVPLPAQALAAG